MTGWAEGMACRVVEHDEATGEPARDGLVVAAVVENVTGPVVEVRAAAFGLLTFYADGWLVAGPRSRLGHDSRWRLLP